MWGGLSRGGWVASAGIFPVVVGAAGQRGVGPRPWPLVGKRDAVDSIGARGGEAAILGVIGVRFQQLAPAVGDAEDHQGVRIIAEIERRAIGVGHMGELRGAIVGICGHRSHAVLCRGDLQGVIGVTVGKGERAAAGAGDRGKPVRAVVGKRRLISSWEMTFCGRGFDRVPPRDVTWTKKPV